MVGRLFGMVTTASDGTTAPLGGVITFAGTAAALASAAAALASGLAVAPVLALVALWFSSLSSFCSSRRSCCFKSAISAAVSLVVCAAADEAAKVPIPIAQ